jgi:hypothetical protein
MFEYYLDNENNYILNYDGEELFIGKEISIAVSCDDINGQYTLHKHGEKKLVTEWYNTAVKAYRANGFDAMANELKMLSGKIALDDLNRSISTTGYVKKLFMH